MLAMIMSTKMSGMRETWLGTEMRRLALLVTTSLRRPRMRALPILSSSTKRLVYNPHPE
jgi:hypothetical protein